MQPSIVTIMTPFPVTVAETTPAIAALSIMKGHEIKHLPVLRNGEVVAVISERDLTLAHHLGRDQEESIAGLCIRAPLALAMDTPLKSAVREMANAGVNAAVVLKEGRLAGILTLTDVSRALVHVLPEPFVDRPGPLA